MDIFLDLNLPCLILALHKDLNLSRLVFALRKDFGLVITFCDHVTFFVIAILVQKNSRAGVYCHTLLNFEKCISIYS